MHKRFLLVVLLLLVLVMNLQAQEAAGGTPNYAVIYNGSTFNGIQTTFTYTVSGTSQPPALSHFNLSLPDCTPALDLVSFSPSDAVSLGVDPTTGVDGIKWDLPLGESATRTYSLTFLGFVAEGFVTAAVKNGDGFFTVNVGGPSCAQAGLSVEKSVSIDNGASWADADNAPGPEVPLDGNVLFRFTVSNTGRSPITALRLADDKVDVSACVLPETLGVGESVSCVVGPLDVEEGQHANLATVQGAFTDATDVTITDTDAAHYFGGELDDDVIEVDDDDDNIIIVIVGPVKEIRDNIIIIYDLEIELSDDDPLLLVIRVGDRVRVQGRWSGDVIIVINIIIIDVDIIIADDVIWRDDGECNNPPPPWAPAEGWRRKCEGGGVDDRGRGRDDDDDDDDD